MISSVEQDQEQLKLWLGKLLLSAQMGHHLDHSAWFQVNALSRMVVPKLKEVALLPKSLLKTLRVATKCLREEAARHKDGVVLMKMADELDYALDLILVGEA